MRDCDACLDATKTLLGCEEEVQEYTVHGGFKTTRCPVKLFTYESLVQLNCVRLFEQGVQLDSCGLLEMPHKFVELVKFVKNESAKHETYLLKNIPK